MESRLRRLLTKREKTATRSSQQSVQNSSSSSCAPEWPSKVAASYTPSDSNSVYTAMDDECTTLQAIPYDAVCAGKVPIFSSKPVRGNGPVKLQTCRRLSTGELLPTSQDHKRTLNDIREGDYIVGRKDKRGTRSRNMAISTLQATPALSMSLSSSESSGSPRTPPPASACAWSLSLDEHVENSVRPSGETDRDGLGILSGPVTSFQTHSGHWHSGNARLTSGSRSSYVSTATSPSVHTIDEQNTTIAALLKAKNNRLVDMYRRDKIHTTGATCATTSYKNQGQVLDPALDGLCSPRFPNLEDNTRRSSNTSAAFSQCYDENSEASSTKRASFISSVAESSYTTQTNTTDYDAVATRDDIRKLVDQMRSTYIRAIETNTPPVPKPSHKKKRRVKPVTGTRVKLPAMPSERQTWHGNHKRQSLLRNNIERETTPHPVSEPRQLPLASQRRERPVCQLQRADSSTLGSIMSKQETRDGHEKIPEDTVPAQRLSIKRQAALFDLEFPQLEAQIDEELANPGLRQPEILSAHNTRPAGNFF